MAYIEAMLIEYDWTLEQLWLEVEVNVGFALLEARGHRMNPGGASGYIDRAVGEAYEDMRERIAEQFRIIP